jgi:STE24 endopeptidase
MDPRRAAAAIRPVDDAWRAALPLEAKAATRAYLDRLSPETVARSNAYFEGRNWLLLWNWLLSLAIAALLLFTRPSSALRDWAVARLRWAPARDGFYGGAYMAAVWALGLPLAIYEGFVREHAYGMATQTFAAWFGEQLVALGVAVVSGALAVAVLYAVLRRVGASWWLWGTAVTMAFMALFIAVAPVLIDPLFNTYRPVPEGPLKSAVLAMARANGVPVDNVYVFDASRQTTRVSANVSGLFGTAAVRLNDNLLERSSEAEVRAVMAHEIGHYALNHIPKTLAIYTLVVMVGFLLSQWAMQRLLARFGARWKVPGVADVASLPLLAAVLGTYFFLATPVFNTLSRAHETEADLWGLSLAREPHGMAEVLLKLVEYRKPDPGALEEFIFFTHPSARTRIHNAMRWREQMARQGAPG